MAPQHPFPLERDGAWTVPERALNGTWSAPWMALEARLEWHLKCALNGAWNAPWMVSLKRLNGVTKSLENGTWMAYWCAWKWCLNSTWKVYATPSGTTPVTALEWSPIFFFLKACYGVFWMPERCLLNTCNDFFWKEDANYPDHL